MVDFRYLKAFMLTAKYSSFSKAAEELNIAQSAVSRQIKLLEDSLQEELIIRSSKKVILSEKGKELYQASLSFEKTSMQIFEREDKLPLTIGILEGLLKTWFTPLLTEYLKHQIRDVSVHVADMPELKNGIEGIIQPILNKALIHYCAEFGLVDCIELIGEYNYKNLNLNVLTNNGKTPLDIALENNRMDAYQKLIEIGCDLTTYSF